MLAEQDAKWRDPQQIVTQWPGSQHVDPELLKQRVSAKWWEILDAARMTLFVTREYEHLVLAMTVLDGSPTISYLPIPHPSGLVVNTARNTIHIASTRNPNMIFDFSTPAGQNNQIEKGFFGKTLLPRRAHFYPGSLYLHDLAILAGKLHANAVGQNAIIELRDDGGYERVWWPNCIENNGQPYFDRNYIQLNSIGAGDDLASSHFSASTDKPGWRRPGHRNFPVDKRGVIFSGATREPIASGLTRPHSVRHYDGNIYIDNSGYGELAVVDGGRIKTIARLPGWTRGLAFHEEIAFVGTSRVIPRFKMYAPGLDIEKSECGLHAVDLKTGQILASMSWPQGNQIFAIDLAPQEMTHGFAARVGSRRALNNEHKFYYTF